MKSYALHCPPAELDACLKGHEKQDIDLVLMFTSSSIMRDELVRARIRQNFPHAHLLGCSTSGQIGDGVSEDSISLLGLKFERSAIKTAAIHLSTSAESYEAGKKLGTALSGENLAGVFVLSPGLNINGSQLTHGLRDSLPKGVSISGGLAGDGLDFKETFTVHDDHLSQDHVVAFGIYGTHVKVQSGAYGGWKPFGPLRRVTRAQDNILYELDGKPALMLYKEYLGDKAADLPASGLLYPFAIMDDRNSESVGLIRTILNVNEDENSLILAGDIAVGSLVCLMHTSTDELVDGAAEAARLTLGGATAVSNAAVICVSCVGRKILMGDDTEEEVDSVRAAFGGLPIYGFYSYGEISSFRDTGEPELHNQTMTITYITEEAA